MHDGSEHAAMHAHKHTQSIEEATALLNYMLDHNAHHAEELHALSHDLEDHGKAEAATLLHECARDFESANAKLAAALDKLKEA